MKNVIMIFTSELVQTHLKVIYIMNVGVFVVVELNQKLKL